MSTLQTTSVTLEYVAIHVYLEEANIFVKLVDSLPFSAPDDIKITDSKIKKVMESVKDSLEEDEHEIKSFDNRNDLTVYVFQNSNVFYYFLIRVHLDTGSVNVHRVQQLFGELKRDLK